WCRGSRARLPNPGQVAREGELATWQPGQREREREQETLTYKENSLPDCQIATFPSLAIWDGSWQPGMGAQYVRGSARRTSEHHDARLAFAVGRGRGRRSAG